MKPRAFLCCTCLFLLSLFGNVPTHATTIVDVLILYTPGATSRYNGAPETRINHLVNVTNQVYSDSGLDLKIRAVHMEEVNYPDNTDSGDALDDVTDKSHPAFADVDALRTTYGADMVMLYRPYHSAHNSCGIAWIGGYNSNGSFAHPYYKSIMYSHVSISTCGDYVTSHELGHNMGLLHSRRQDSSGGTLPHALGYGVDNQFVTVMAYQSAFNVNYWLGKIYKFSSPSLDCNGYPCGINKTNSSQGADASSTLALTTPQIANFYPTEVNDLDTAEQAMLAAQQTFANAQSNYDNKLATYNSAKNRHTRAKNKYIKAYRVYKKKKSAANKTRYLVAKKVFKRARSVTKRKKNLYLSAKRLLTIRTNQLAAASQALIVATRALSTAESNYLLAQSNYQTLLTEVG